MEVGFLKTGLEQYNGGIIQLDAERTYVALQVMKNRAVKNYGKVFRSHVPSPIKSIRFGCQN